MVISSKPVNDEEAIRHAVPILLSKKANDLEEARMSIESMSRNQSFFRKSKSLQNFQNAIISSA